jgi:hypothetical protein
VARIDDKSGNGQNFTEATAGNRPILRQAGGIYYLEFDATDDRMTSTAYTQTAPYDHLMAARRTSGIRWVPIWFTGNSDAALGVGEDGSTANTTIGVTGNPEHAVNGVSLQPKTRGATYSACFGVDVVFETKGCTSAGGAAGITLAGYSGYIAGTRFYGSIMCSNMTNTERNIARAWLGKLMGLTL